MSDIIQGTYKTAGECLALTIITNRVVEDWVDRILAIYDCFPIMSDN